MAWYPPRSVKYNHEPASHSYYPREEGYYSRGWGRGSGGFTNDYQWEERRKPYFGATTQSGGERYFGGRASKYQRQHWNTDSSTRRTVTYTDDGAQPMDQDCQAAEYGKERVPRKEHHCKCCPRSNPKHCKTGYDHSELQEDLEMMDQDEPSTYPRSSFRRERIGSRYQQHYGQAYPHSHQQRYRHHQASYGHAGQYFYSVANPTIAKRRLDPPGSGGRYYGGYNTSFSGNHFKFRKDHQTRSYWQQLQAGLEKGERGRRGIDLKSDSAVSLTLDDIISKTQLAAFR